MKLTRAVLAMKRPARFLLLIGFLLLASGVSHAQDDPLRDIELASLRGLNGITVMVAESIIDSDVIKTTAELKLRSAGIKVFSKANAGEDTGFLWITVTALRVGDTSAYACSLSVELRQGVTPIRNPRLKVLGSTWHTSGVAAIGRSVLQETIKTYITQYVEKFANDYLSENER